MPTPREVFFESEEYARRVASVQAAMAEAGLDLLVTPSPGNICYLNGYVSMNVLDIMFLCLPAEGDAVFYIWQFERGRAQSTVTGSETVCWDTGVEPIAFVAEDLSRRGLKRRPHRHGHRQHPHLLRGGAGHARRSRRRSPAGASWRRCAS